MPEKKLLYLETFGCQMNVLDSELVLGSLRRQGWEETAAADLGRPVGVGGAMAVRGERHSAYVTVMRGCDFACTYCIVPTTRGPEISRTIEEIREEVLRLCADGVREVTFLGQTVDSYG